MFNFNIDWKNFNALNVLNGCGALLGSGLNLTSQKVKDTAKFRLQKCEICELNVKGRCFRDWNDEDEKEVKKIVDVKYQLELQKSASNKEVLRQEYIDKERESRIKLYKKHTIHKGKVYLGCGCNIKCKVFSMDSTCPAQKWHSVH